MLANARTEADDILTKAEADGKQWSRAASAWPPTRSRQPSVRRSRAFAHRAVTAATAASRQLIAEKHGEDARPQARPTRSSPGL